MKNLIIIGSGGMGREVYNLAINCEGFNKSFIIKGFLDNWPDAINSFEGYPPVIGLIEDYCIQPDDVFVCSFGSVAEKKRAVQIILEKGGEFINLIHPSASIHNAKIGNGCIILKNSVIGDHAKIGNFVLIQVSTLIGHDTIIGDYSRIDCQAVCVGGVIIEEGVTIHTSAVVNHKVKIGKGACVGALSFVIKNVKENSTVQGNPAIRLK